MEKGKRRINIRRTLVTIILIGFVAGVTMITIRSVPGGKPFVPLIDPLSSEEINEDAVSVTILTWNIRWGSEKGPYANKWNVRKESFRSIFEQLRETDIICFQETLREQLLVFDQFLPHHARVGVGREDGRFQGEYCAIYYPPMRFRKLESGTFWLSDTPDVPSRSWGARHYRICTWIRLQEQNTSRTFLVFNTHFPLRNAARERSAELLVTRIRQEQMQGEPVIVAGDLNSGPNSDPREILERAGLRSTEIAGRFTFHWRGIGLASLDAVLVSQGWRVERGDIIKTKGGRIYPSDHYGVRVTLRMTKIPE